MKKTRRTPTSGFQPIRKLLAAIVMEALASVSIAQIEPSQADALSSFDSELLSLMNAHRSSLGLGPLVEYGPLSDAATNWSNSMLAQRNRLNTSSCRTAGNQAASFLVHDSPANVGSQGVPPGTTGVGENLAWSCGVVGGKFAVSWSYNAMPVHCVGQIDYTSALMQFCGWVDSAPHRVNLESAAFNHVGLGTVMKTAGAQSEPISTARFARAPVRTLCDGREVTVNMNENGGNGNGTNGNDVILGTPGDDVINGFGGDDRICAEGGRDRVFGGAGADRIFGGFGIDYLYGEAGRDTLDGQGGSDRMYGGSGGDLMLGGSGADRMFGGDANDEMRGMGGQDFMWGGNGNDLMQGNFQTDNMRGGSGNDTMFGAGGKDTLFGDAGNDALNGGANTDHLNGGSGTDSAHGGRGKDNPVVAPRVRASNGQLFNGSGCIAETTVSC